MTEDAAGGWDVDALDISVTALSIALGVWTGRDDSRAEPEVRRAANDAMDCVDAMLRELQLLRGRLVSEIRKSDEAAAARVDVRAAGVAWGRLPLALFLPGAARFPVARRVRFRCWGGTVGCPLADGGPPGGQPPLRPRGDQRGGGAKGQLTRRPQYRRGGT